MHSLSLITPLFFILSIFRLAATSPAGSELGYWKYYTRAHSLGENYRFDSREWHTLNATNMAYADPVGALSKRGKKSKDKDTKGASKDSGGVAGLLNGVWNGLKGIGGPQSVKITW
jgi:hypothetical protein